MSVLACASSRPFGSASGAGSGVLGTPPPGVGAGIASSGSSAGARCVSSRLSERALRALTGSLLAGEASREHSASTPPAAQKLVKASGWCAWLANKASSVAICEWRSRAALVQGGTVGCEGLWMVHLAG